MSCHSIVFFLIFQGVAVFGMPRPGIRVNEPDTHFFQAGWKLPSFLSVSRVEKLLNRFTQEVYGKGFRYLGVDQDFFHGHLLLERRQEGDKRVSYAHAILYHTQEEAHAAHWRGDVDPKYDYLNVTTRNWIQWLDESEERDGIVIENARVYLDEKTKEPKQFFEEVPPQETLFYTIHSKNLDEQKLGFTVYADLQFTFNEESCEGIQDNVYGYKQGPIRVVLPPSQTVCLNLQTNNFLLERQPR